MAQKICWDICPRTLSVPRSEQFSESVARGKLSFEEQIMSKEKYASIFLCQMEVCVYYPSNIFFATRAGLQFVEYFSWGIFGRVTRLDQSRGRKIFDGLQARIFYIRSEKRTIFWEQSSRNTVNFLDEIMSKDKYPSILSRQMEAIYYIILLILFATCTVSKIGEYVYLITHPLIFEWFYWLLYVTWCKSPNSYHAITPARVDICPPIVSVEEKHSQRKNFNFFFP